MPLTQRWPHACALALIIFACAFVAHAQQNDNTASKSNAKTIAGMSSSDTPGGSKVTISSDGVLNDYSAYRSGDRFYVVIPQANAKGLGGVRGRGFEGAQVTRRGQDVVMSFKLQPGASARVDQRFNRLVVQFNAADVGSQTPPKNANQASAQPTPEPRAQTSRTPVELAGAPTPTARPTPDPNRQTNSNLPPGVIPTPLTAPPTTIAQATPAVAVPSPIETPAGTPAATPVQIAQVQPPPVAPVVPTTSAPNATAPVSLGTTVLRNWPWLVIALILLACLGLFVFARGTERREELPPASEPALQTEPAKSALAAKGLAATGSTAAVVPPGVVATPPVVVAASPAVDAPAKPAPSVVAAPTTTKSATPPKSKKAKRAAQKREAALAAAKAAEAGATKPEAVEPTTTEPPAIEAAETSAPSTGTTNVAALASGAVVAAGAVALTHESAPSVVDAEPAVAETKKLLAGEAYDEAVIGTRDAGVRRLVAAELMTSLATESESAKVERARAAFITHGYFEDVARDLSTAEAPEQRASAARTLGLVGDHAATPHLVAALEDPAAEVRRASVDALTELQDPAAVSPLEALRWRETSRQIPRNLIQAAIEACAAAAPPAPVELPTATATEPVAVEPAPTEAAAVEPAITEAAIIEPAVVESATVAPAVAEAATSEVVLDEPVVTEPASVTPAPEVAVAEPPPALDETTQEVAPVTPEIETVTAAPADVDVAAPVEVVTAELHAAMTAPDIAPAPEVAPVEAAMEATPAPALVESAPEIPAAMDDVFALTPPVEAAPVLDVPELATEPVREEVETLAAPAEMTDALAPSPAAPEVVEYDDITWPAPAASEPTTSVATTTVVPDEPETLFAAEPPVPAESPAATEETKEITAFVMTPSAPVADDWIDIDVEEHKLDAAPAAGAATAPPRVSYDTEVEEHAPIAWSMPTEVSATDDTTKGLEPLTLEPLDATFAAAPAVGTGKELDLAGAEEERLSIIPKAIQLRMESDDASERAASVTALTQLNTDEAFQQICAAFDDPAPEVREAAARALYTLADDRADSFTRALREAAPERRRHIGAAISASGLADEAVSNLTGESRDKTYDAFSLLFLMAKAGETAPLIHAIETHPDNEVRLAVVKLLALSGQHEILPSFRRLAVRGSLPTEVRSAVMEAIYQISSQPQHT